MKSLLTIIAFAALIVILVVAGPLLVIWALNTLFPALAIPYTGWTWLAALILGAAVGPNIKYKR
jgi:hypothetical protein